MEDDSLVVLSQTGYGGFVLDAQKERKSSLWRCDYCSVMVGIIMVMHADAEVK